MTPEALIGQTIGEKYRVNRLLGAGGMGCVVEATHVLTGGVVALKLIQHSTNEVTERLLLEAKAPSIVDHPNVVRVHDVGFDPALGVYFLVQDVLHGHDLGRELSLKGKMLWKEAVKLLLPVVSAVSSAHKAGLVHRDLKPDNIFLSKTQDGTIVPLVLDFGIARVVAGQRTTMDGAVLGTPGYMSPEQAKGERDVTQRSDVFSLGVILYECITGICPFDSPDANYHAILHAVVSKTPDPILPSDAPVDLRSLIERMLSKDQNHRPASMETILRCLENITGDAWSIDGQTTIEAPDTLSTITTERLKNRADGSRWRIAAMVILSAITVASGASIGTVLGRNHARVANASSVRVVRNETTVTSKAPPQTILRDPEPVRYVETNPYLVTGVPDAGAPHRQQPRARPRRLTRNGAPLIAVP